jgi:hypothetical protein
LIYSNATGTGFLAALDSAIGFFPTGKIVTPQRLTALTSIFDKDAKAAGTTALAKQQYKIMRQWLLSDKMADVELIQWSKGLFGMEAGKSYIFVLAGVSVSTGQYQYRLVLTAFSL